MSKTKLSSDTVLKSALIALVVATTTCLGISLGNSVEVNMRPWWIQVKVNHSPNNHDCIFDALPPATERNT